MRGENNESHLCRLIFTGAIEQNLGLVKGVNRHKDLAILYSLNIQFHDSLRTLQRLALCIIY